MRPTLRTIAPRVELISWRHGGVVPPYLKDQQGKKADLPPLPSRNGIRPIPWSSKNLATPSFTPAGNREANR
jgi:hypothetical protein